MPDDAYDPADLRVLAGMDPPRRDPADPLVRRAGEFLAPPEPDDVSIEEVIAMVRGVPDVPPDPGDEWPPVEPVLDYSHRLLPDGTPRYPLNDAETVRHMRAHGFSEADVRHVLGYDPGPPSGVPGGAPETPGEPIE